MNWKENIHNYDKYFLYKKKKKLNHSTELFFFWAKNLDMVIIVLSSYYPKLKLDN